MILLKPNQISGEIMTILDEADEKVIIVTPYCKIDKWYKLLKRFSSLKDRQIKTEFYVREGENDSIEQVENIGISPIQIPNLHAKLYMNEKTAIVSSMNLLLSSEMNSLDIGYKTTTNEEYKELEEFYNRYLHKKEVIQKSPDNPINKISEFIFDWKKYVEEKLNEKIRNVKFHEEDGVFKIKTYKNNYECFVWNDKNKNLLRVTGILSNNEYLFSNENIEKINNNCSINITIQSGGKGYYDTILGTTELAPYSKSISGIISIDQKKVATSILEFIIEVERIKNMRLG